jgi:mRNA-degrading endonuclease RelE of RelBE toxin-antitoxin system
MKTKYLPTFIKELKKLKSSPNYSHIRKFIFEEIIICPDLSNISIVISIKNEMCKVFYHKLFRYLNCLSPTENDYNIKKLKGEINAYRWRIGDYRVGFFIENDTIIFARVLHRREFYRYFP